VAALLGRHSKTLKLVFLNGCCSLELGRKLRQRDIEAVVCWSTKAHDGAARIFARKFFEACATGSSLVHAFDAAVQAVRNQETVTGVKKYVLEGPPEPLPQVLPSPLPAGTPVLLCSGAGADGRGDERIAMP